MKLSVIAVNSLRDQKITTKIHESWKTVETHTSDSLIDYKMQYYRIIKVGNFSCDVRSGFDTIPE